MWSLAASAVYSYLPDNAVGDYSTLESRYYTCVILVVYFVLTYVMAIPEAEVMRQWLAEDAPGTTVASWAGILDEAYALYIEALGLTMEEPFQTFAFFWKMRNMKKRLTASSSMTSPYGQDRRQGSAASVQPPARLLDWVARVARRLLHQ